MSLSRSLCLFRPFASRSSQLSTTPSPPRRKGRIPPPDPTTQSLLPPEKQRALITLYHLSEKIITPENLDERIKQAFEYPISIPDDVSQPLLDDTLKQQRAATKMSLWNTDLPMSFTDTRYSTWSSAMSEREVQVKDALCGTDTVGRTLPGYGTLMQARKERETTGAEQWRFLDGPEPKE